MHNDKIELQHTSDGIQVFINRRNLIELLREYEEPLTRQEHPSPEAGGYAPIPREKFLTQSFDIDSDDDMLLYNCSACEEDGCWPMVVKVKNIGTKVIWSDFQQPHRDITSHNFWDYSHFGPFYFETTDYQRQLASLDELRTR